MIFIRFISIIVLLSSTTLHAKEIALSDNFYQSVNHTWLEKTPIPDAEPLVSSFSEIKTNDIDQPLREVMERETPKSKDEQTLRNMYRSLLDMEKRDQRGISPIKPYLQAVENAKNRHDIALLMSDFHQDGVAMPLDFEVLTDFKRPGYHVMFMYQTTLGIAREHYLGNSERAKIQRAIYTDFLEQLFDLAGFSHTSERVKHVMQIETALAKHQDSPAEVHNFKKIYNPYDFKALLAIAPHLPLDAMLERMHIPKKRMIVQLPSYVQAVDQMFQQTSLAVWQDYVRAQVLLRFSHLLSSDFERVALAHDKKLGLLQKEPAPWQKGVFFISQELQQLTGKVYVKNFFDEASKHYVERMVEYIREAFRQRISHASRLDEKTKRNALRKINQLTYSIAYPEIWQDFSKLTFKPDDLMGNVVNWRHFKYAYELEKLSRKVLPSDWERGAHEINAAYDPTINKFILSAAMLHKPFFDIHASDAQNYAGIGSVIGHEIGHGFDNHGRLFDADGRMVDWWTAKDAASFEQLQAKVMAQANAYELFPGVHLNGALKVDEAIADINGADIALLAYQNQAKDKPDLQTFFRQYATIWREKYRPEFAMMVLEIDPHPPGEFRTNNTLINMDSFYQTFVIKPGDKMYRKPAERVKMW